MIVRMQRRMQRMRQQPSTSWKSVASAFAEWFAVPEFVRSLLMLSLHRAAQEAAVQQQAAEDAAAVRWQPKMLTPDGTTARERTRAMEMQRK